MHVFFSYYSHYLKNIRNGTENMERLSGKGTIYCCYKTIIKSSLKKNSKYKVLIVLINLLFIQIFRGTYSSLSYRRCRAITASVRETIQEIPRKKGKKKKNQKSVYSINALVIIFWCYSSPSLIKFL